MAEVVYLYGVGSTITKTVWPKLVAEMPAGTRVVSMRFPIKGVEPVRTDIAAEGGYPVFLYIIAPK